MVTAVDTDIEAFILQLLKDTRALATKAEAEPQRPPTAKEFLRLRRKMHTMDRSLSSLHSRLAYLVKILVETGRLDERVVRSMYRELHP